MRSIRLCSWYNLSCILFYLDALSGLIFCLIGFFLSVKSLFMDGCVVLTFLSRLGNKAEFIDGLCHESNGDYLAPFDKPTFSNQLTYSCTGIE